MSVDTERILISQVLSKPSLIDDQELSETMFSTADYQAIFTAIEVARKELPKVDLVGIGAMLEKAGRSDLITTAASLEYVSPANASFYAEQLRETRRRKNIARSLATGIEALKDAQKKSAELADSVISDITAAVSEAQEPETPTIKNIVFPYGEVVAKRVKDRRAGVKQLVAFGVMEIDRIIQEVRPGEVLVIAGRPGAGKTALALQLLHHSSDKLGTTGAFFSLEMKRDEVMDRLIAQSGVASVSSLRGGYMSDEQASRFQERLADLYTVPLAIYDGAQNLATIKSRIRREKAARGLTIACIDYLGLIDLGQGGKTPRWERVGEVSRTLKLLALELGIVIVEVVQMNREADGQEPTLGVLRDSGAIEQDADRVIMLHVKQQEEQDSKQTERQVQVIVAKNRHGPCGKAMVSFDGAYVHFSSEKAVYGA